MILIICGLVIIFFVNNDKVFICFWDFNVEYSVMLKNILFGVLFIFLFLKFDYYCFFNNNCVVVVD